MSDQSTFTRQPPAVVAEKMIGALWPHATDAQVTDGVEIIVRYWESAQTDNPSAEAQQAYAEKVPAVFGPIKEAIHTWGPNGHLPEKAATESPNLWACELLS